MGVTIHSCTFPALCGRLVTLIPSAADTQNCGESEPTEPLASAGAKCQCAFVHVGNIIIRYDLAKKPTNCRFRGHNVVQLDNN
jgi:hypothetical protein